MSGTRNILPEAGSEACPSSPHVSVVMGVYNGGARLQATVESILNQTFRDFEFIIVNDGSSDDTGAKLEAWERMDNRLRVIHQENGGLTKALARGCSLARGLYIARQDCGDISLPDRLAEQVQYLARHEEVVLCCPAVEVIGPEGELLSVVRFSEASLEMTQAWVEHGAAPVHPAVMFRASAYRECGGYREEFAVAQDHDLWYRLVRLGQFGAVQRPLFRLILDSTGISARRKAQQRLLAKIARDCYQCAGRGESGSASLAEAAAISRQPGTSSPRGDRLRSAELNYFIASCLLARHDRRAISYLTKVLRSTPAHVRAWLKLVYAALFCRGKRGTFTPEHNETPLKPEEGSAKIMTGLGRNRYL